MTTTAQSDGLLERRSVTGVLVHPLALLTGGLAAIVIYLLARHEYTKANARNALNWYLSFLALFIIAILTFFLGADDLEVAGQPVEWGIVPEPFGTVLALIGMGLMVVVLFAMLATWIFGIVATIKAIFGTAWKYPLARSFVGDDP